MRALSKEKNFTTEDTEGTEKTKPREYIIRRSIRCPQMKAILMWFYLRASD